MMTTHYHTLGIEKSATNSEIKAAYRRLASKYHPDRCKDVDAEENFKKIQEAYDVLGDNIKRKQYDSTISSVYQDGNTFYFRDGAPIYQKKQTTDLFSISISLEEAYFGARLNTNIGFIDIPAGIRSGTKIRIENKIVEILVLGHDKFIRKNDDLYVMANISFLEAIVGISATVTTIDKKTLKFNIPPNTGDEKLIKLAGKGMPNPLLKKTGDLYIVCKLFMPDDLTLDDIRVILSTLKRNSIQL